MTKEDSVRFVALPAGGLRHIIRGANTTSVCHSHVERTTDWVTSPAELIQLPSCRDCRLVDLRLNAWAWRRLVVEAALELADTNA